jgi:hypothetical protein
VGRVNAFGERYLRGVAGRLSDDKRLKGASVGLDVVAGFRPEGKLSVGFAAGAACPGGCPESAVRALVEAGVLAVSELVDRDIGSMLSERASRLGAAVGRALSRSPLFAAEERIDHVIYGGVAVRVEAVRVEGPLSGVAATVEAVIPRTLCSTAIEVRELGVALEEAPRGLAERLRVSVPVLQAGSMSETALVAARVSSLPQPEASGSLASRILRAISSAVRRGDSAAGGLLLKVTAATGDYRYSLSLALRGARSLLEAAGLSGATSAAARLALALTGTLRGLYLAAAGGSRSFTVEARCGSTWASLQVQGGRGSVRVRVEASEGAGGCAVPSVSIARG